MSACFCGEFDRPTVAPDEFGETCFHDLDKCEVPPRRVPDDAVIRVLRQKATRLTAALADRDRRIDEVLARLQWAACRVRGCSHPSCAAVHDVQDILRGESDE